MITPQDYYFPTTITNGYFSNKGVPQFNTYISNYHMYFLQYIYYMCIMNATGNYPTHQSIENILKEINSKKGNKCKRKIKKILIGEVPPTKPLNYFYNPSPVRWNANTGRPIRGQSWTIAIKESLFPNVTFQNTVSFLKACAREGFLLLDLFPYAISYTRRDSTKYKEACLNAWGSGPNKYPCNIIDILNYLNCCIDETIAIGFGLTSFGSTILNNNSAVNSFTAWCNANNVTLNPLGPLNQHNLPNASNYLRICHKRGMFSPCPNLLNSAGF